jgi:hypothetical protein
MMKRLIVVVSIVFMGYPVCAEEVFSDTLYARQMLAKLEEDLLVVRDRYLGQQDVIWKELSVVNEALRNASRSGDYREMHARLLQKWELENELDLLQKEEEIEMLRTRYRHGIGLIKLLYEKMLSLDHHFSGMEIYQNVMLLSNPNSYPEFKKIREVLEEKLKKKHAITLPSVLHTNPYVSATFSLVAAFIGEGDTKEKQEELEKIACILDFTVKMSADLNIIQYETGFLQLSNLQLKTELERLFEDYCQIIDYLVPLEKCRNEDDWEQLYLKLDQSVEKMREELARIGTGGLPARKISRMLVNFEFATRQVADFMGKYSHFIVQGSQYYQKFSEIIANYSVDESCREAMPMPFEELKRDISHTIEKFEETYSLPELKGSRLKELLYGSLEASG